MQDAAVSPSPSTCCPDDPAEKGSDEEEGSCPSLANGDLSLDTTDAMVTTFLPASRNQ